MRMVKNNKGETLVETLVGLLVSCLAILMLYTYITNTIKAIDESDERMNNYYDRNNELVEYENESEDGIITFSQPIIPNKSTVEVTCYKNEVFDGKTVITYIRK